MDNQLTSLKEILTYIEANLSHKPNPVIAIDGSSASGKTTLAKQIADALDAQIVHMDDFFLPKELRTAERLREPGGNVHYERFLDEVVDPLLQKDAKDGTYRIFNCKVMDYTDRVSLDYTKPIVVEGAYAMHPIFGEYADLKLFLTIDPALQRERILQRNGATNAQMFFDRWIPMEHAYFSFHNTLKHADVVLSANELKPI